MSHVVDLVQFAYSKPESVSADPTDLEARPLRARRKKRRHSKKPNLWLLLDNDIISVVFSHLNDRQIAPLARIDRRTHDVAKQATKRHLGLSDSQWHTFRAVLERRESVFITGAAGSGKSHLLRVLKERLGPKCLVTASTGTAAEKINAGTLHSALCLGFGKESVETILARCRRRGISSALKALIIDEVSMLTGTLLDKVFEVLETLTFGNGMPQLVLCGDPMQLGAVALEREGPFYASSAMKNLVKPYVLTENFRQDDSSHFTRILNRSRIGRASQIDVLWLQSNARQPTELGDANSDITRLYCKCHSVAAYNDVRYAQIANPEVVYEASTMSGAAPVPYVPDKQIKLKVDARVMLTRNSQENGRLFNGCMGTVKMCAPDYVKVQFDNGILYCVRRAWTDHTYRPINTKVPPDAPMQFPLVVAFAVTVHKSQGATLRSVFVNLQGAFAAGQAYVALSRVRNIEDMELVGLDLKKLNHVNRDALRYYMHVREVSEACMEERAEKDIAFSNPVSFWDNESPDPELEAIMALVDG